MESFKQILRCQSEPPITSGKLFDIQEMALEWAKHILHIHLPVKENCYVKRWRTPYTIDELKLSCQWDDISIKTVNMEVTNFNSTENPECVPLSKSNFTNNTEMEQTYSFCTNKSTKSRAILAVHQGMSIGEKTKVIFHVPTEIINETIEFGKSINITTVSGTKVEEDMHWVSQHPIRVPPGSSTTAEIHALERYININFTAQTVVSGKVKILVTDPKDNRLVKELSNDIASIVRHHFERHGPSRDDTWELCFGNYHPMAWFPDGCTWDLTKSSVTFSVKGTSFFQYCYEQRVKISHD